MMPSSLDDLLAKKSILLADGATGTNFFDIGLVAGDAPEFWNVDAPQKVTLLHQQFADAGADILLTNTFGCNRDRLKLHNAQSRVFELNKSGAELVRNVVEGAGRPIIVAGSVGPTGELFEPLGALTHESAFDAFKEQIDGLKAGGADVIWIETMSSREEIEAASKAARMAGMDYVFTASFDTAGKTMMGVAPGEMGAIASAMTPGPVAIGANCGVGASDLLASVLDITAANPCCAVVAKANCGVPQVSGDQVIYTGTPQLMADYVQLAADSGAKIIGGCCGTSPGHLAAMRVALDGYLANNEAPHQRPDIEHIESLTGKLVNKTANAASPPARPRRVRRRA